MTVDLISAPHFLQNFDFLGFSVPQFGQETVELLLVLDSMPNVTFLNIPFEPVVLLLEFSEVSIVESSSVLDELSFN